MLFNNYIKPSQVTDFARTTYRHRVQATPQDGLLTLRIIYRSLNNAELLTYPKKTTNSSRSNQTKLATAEIIGSLSVALILIAMFGGVA